MISITINNLAFRVGPDDIITDVSFSLEDGDRLGIVGVNGSGKSTLMKMIAGEYEASDGNVFIAKDKTIGMLHQDDAFSRTAKIGSADIGDTVLEQMYAAFPELCITEARLAEIEKELQSASPENAARLSAEYDNLNAKYVAHNGTHYKSRCRSILIKLGFDEKMHSLPISALSGGQRTKLALARLLIAEPDILLLDEPTNHLDTETMVWLEGHLASYPKTLMLVSHDRYFLDKVTNKTLDIENHHAKLYKCSYTQYVKQKEEDRAAYEKKYELQQKEIARLEAYIEQQRRWNRERNIIAAESREKAIARMKKVDRPEDAPKSIHFDFTESGESGNDVLSVKNLSMGFGGKPLFSGLSFEVKKRDRFFIAGANGTGKSTLIKILMGQLAPLSGQIKFGYNVSIGYYDQENQNLTPSNTVLDELWNAYPGITQTGIRNTLAMFNFRGDDIQKTVSVLSGGERARLTLAKLILSKMNLLILDEPTNHLDIGSREALENALSEFDGTIIAVSHDRYFTRKLATRMLEISENGCTVINGGYDDYEDFKSRRAAGEADFVPEQQISSSKEMYLKNKQEAAAVRQKQKRKKTVAEEIERNEKRLLEIQDELLGEAATDYVRAAKLEDERIATEDILMNLYEEEEELAALFPEE